VSVQATDGCKGQKLKTEGNVRSCGNCKRSTGKPCERRLRESLRSISLSKSRSGDGQKQSATTRVSSLCRLRKTDKYQVKPLDKIMIIRLLPPDCGTQIHQSAYRDSVKCDSNRRGELFGKPSARRRVRMPRADRRKNSTLYAVGIQNPTDRDRPRPPPGYAGKGTGSHHATPNSRVQQRATRPIFQTAVRKPESLL